MRQAQMQPPPAYGGMRQQGGPRGPQADLGRLQDMQYRPEQRHAVMPPGSAQRMTPEAMQQLNPGFSNMRTHDMGLKETMGGSVASLRRVRCPKV